VALVHQVVQAVRSRSWIGGIARAEDAFALIGATAVQVGTANFADPSAMQTIIDTPSSSVQGRHHDIHELIEV
jgi:dihydroorotate dehydrogenase (NAD+) catalytic subunit